MEKKKQSSVEWLVNQISYKMDIRIEDTTIGCDLFKQAKSMHKEEITDAYHDGKTNGMYISHDLSLTKEISSTEYYNETFVGQDNVLGVAINEAEEALSQFAVSGRSEQSSLIHHCGNELTEKEIFHDHCLKCSEYISED